MSFGVLVGAGTAVLAAALAVLGSMAAPVAVGLGAMVIVLAAQVRVLSTIPACFNGFASVAGLMLMKGVAPSDAIAPSILSVVLGTAFAVAASRLAGALARRS